MSETMSERRQEAKKDAKKESFYDTQPILNKRRKSHFKSQVMRFASLLFVIVICICLYFLFLRFSDITAAVKKVVKSGESVLYGLAIAYLLNPIVKWTDRHLLPFLEEKFPRLKNAKSLSRGIGVALAVIVLVAVVVSLIGMMLPALIRGATNMILTLPTLISRWTDWFNDVFRQDSAVTLYIADLIEEWTDSLQEWIRTDLLGSMNSWMGQLTIGLVAAVKGFFSILIGLVISVYVLCTKERLAGQCKKILYALFEPDIANMILHMAAKSDEIFGGFIIGKLIDSAIMGVLCYIGTRILGTPYGLVVSVVIGVTNVIPFFGPYLGGIPCTVLVFLINPLQGIYFGVFLLALQQFDGNILGPRILGNSTGLSSFWVMTAILVFGGIFGIPGMILGVPAFGVIYYIVNMYISDRLRRRKLPTNTGSYNSHSHVENDGTYVDEMLSQKKTAKKKTKKKPPTAVGPKTKEPDKKTPEANPKMNSKEASGNPETEEPDKKTPEENPKMNSAGASGRPETEEPKQEAPDVIQEAASMEMPGQPQGGEDSHADSRTE